MGKNYGKSHHGHEPANSAVYNNALVLLHNPGGKYASTGRHDMHQSRVSIPSSCCGNVWDPKYHAARRITRWKENLQSAPGRPVRLAAGDEVAALRPGVRLQGAAAEGAIDGAPRPCTTAPELRSHANEVP